jgi:hypothetical protein
VSVDAIGGLVEIVAWVWPFVFVAWSQATWLLWPLLGIGPARFLLVLVLRLRSRRTTM